MGEIVNLRKVRKQLKKRDEAERAAANRLIHGQPKAERNLETARASKIDRYLDGHKIERGDA
jgi:ribosomal protein S2